MSAAGMPRWSLRLEQAESSRLAWAFGISLAVHLLFFSVYQTGKKLNWWQNVHWPAWMQSSKMLTEVLKKKPITSPQQLQPQIPLIFVDVSAAQATPEPPKKADYYSDKNSKAANPDTTLDTDKPKIEGKQTHVVKTEDVPKTKNIPLQPAPLPQPSPAAKEAQEEQKPKSAYTPGDLALAKPEVTPRKEKDEGQAEHARPRNLVEARARLQQATGLMGEKMKQEGGVRRAHIFSSFDAISTPFGAYDAAIIAAVQYRWYSLLDDQHWAGGRTGKVMVRFVLHSNGRVTEASIVENTVDFTLALLCERAILDPAPYAAWPLDMKRLIGGDDREVTFTFFYD
jgi:outer membrane biosynthesis protein TonB